MSKKTWIIIAIIVGLGGLIGATVGYYMWNKPHDDIRALDTDYEMQAEELYTAFFNSEDEANKKYLNKVIEVSGTIKEISNGGENVNILLGVDGQPGGVQCQLDPVSGADEETFEKGTKVTLKGKCAGSTMFDVQLARCVHL